MMGSSSEEVVAVPSAARINRRFYTWFVVCAFLIIFAGFAHTFYLRLFFETAALPLFLHLHGLLFTAWRGGPTNLDKFRGRDKWNSAGYAAAASG